MHQVKRQHGTASEWKLSDLNANGVLAAAREHASGGRRFWFISTIPSVVLSQLADAARRSPDVGSFVEHMLGSEPLRTGWDYLTGKAYGSPEVAWQALQGLEVLWPDERDLTHMNAALAGLLLEGAAPQLAAVGLGSLVPDHLRVPLDAAKLIELLKPLGLRPRRLLGNSTNRQDIRGILAGWQENVGRELLQPAIRRAEAADLTDQLRNSPRRLLFVVGEAGGGKSVVLHQAVAQIEADGWPVLALRLDHIEPFSSTIELGRRKGLDVSPVTALAAAAQDGPSMLVVDQLDAVSLASGRMPASFETVTDLLREAGAFPGMRVVLACRKFDVENDHRIRALAAAREVTQIQVGPLTTEQVDAAVLAMGLAADQLTDRQRELLMTPLHLVLLRSIADQPDALSFATETQLFDAYWNRKRYDCREQRPQPPLRFPQVVSVLVEAMSERQRLSAPVSVLDDSDLGSDADVLISQGVLVPDGSELAFFHEGFFDYAFARHWLAGRQTLEKFLHSSEQELFRRTQVRQILIRLHGDDPERFVSEVEAILTDSDARFHIKDLVLAFLRALTEPTVAEWELMGRLIAAGLPFADRLWLTMRTLPWFKRLDAEGFIADGLASSDNADHRRVLELMLGAVKEQPDRIAGLVAPYAGRTPDYPAWLSWIIRFGNIYESRALFELVTAAIRRGDFEGIEHALWLGVHGLGQQQPGWAAELLGTYLAERPHAFDVNTAGRVMALNLTDHALKELTAQSAEGAPQEFLEQLVPYLLQVMELTGAQPAGHPMADRHLSHSHPIDGPAYDLDDALSRGTAAALRKLVTANPEAARPVLEILAADPHDAAQWFLYEGLRSAGEHYADWAAALLLEGDHRLISGYAENPVWTTRRLLEAITPHVPAKSFAALEHAVIDLRPSWQTTVGWASFTLLSGMAESKLSQTGRQQLGELRRRFKMEQLPVPGPRGGCVRAPIPPEAAGHLSDEQWLGVMNRYNTDTADYETLRGGAHELSQILKTQAIAEPIRFARLALRLDGQAHAAYSQAILIALADTTEHINPRLVFDVIRHIASLGYEEHQDWLGWPLRKYIGDEIPDDIVQIILDRALHAASPAEDSWQDTDGDIFMAGFNSARGISASILGDLLIHDATGHRTAQVIPSLPQLAEDPVVAVRCCVAHLLTACLRYARTEVTAAFEMLVAADDRLLATRQVLDLMGYIGLGEPKTIEPVIRRMLHSIHPEVREAGGWMAAFAGLDLGLDHLLTATCGSTDAPTRKGAARQCAHRLPRTSNPQAAAAALSQFMTDHAPDVHEAAAEVAAALRGQPLRPYAKTLKALIDSPSFSHALPQLLITLRNAPDRIDNLVIQSTRRFLEIHGTEASDLSTAAAAQAPEIGRLVLRAYTQASGATARAATLDLIDGLLLSGTYDMAQLVDEAER